MLHRGRSGALGLAGCGVMLALGASAVAEDTKQDPEGPPTSPVIAAECDLTDFKTGTQVFTPPEPIPPTNPAGITLGPIVLPDDGMFIEVVVIELDMAHTFVADLIVRVHYDENSDGIMDATSTLMCRPGRSSCAPVGTGGCAFNLTTGAIYRFDDTATAPLPCATTNIPGGCYQPTGDGATSLLAFEGRTKGGRWWLFVSDNQAGDTGTVTSWSVHLKNTPVSAIPASWGQLKAIYR